MHATVPHCFLSLRFRHSKSTAAQEARLRVLLALSLDPISSRRHHLAGRRSNKRRRRIGLLSGRLITGQTVAPVSPRSAVSPATASSTLPHLEHAQRPRPASARNLLRQRESSSSSVEQTVLLLGRAHQTPARWFVCPRDAFQALPHPILRF